MPLDLAKIKELQEKSRTRGRTKKPTGPIPRDYQNWFKLQHKMVDIQTGELMHCENEDCEDPRRENNPEYRGISVAEVNGRFMCRHCFLGGWLTKDEDQLEL
jgi:hypothetical protein